MDNNDEGTGLRILCLDGGGPGCFSQLVILDEYMSRIAHEKQTSKSELCIADCLDLIGGVGFGAYISVMLGALRMSIPDAMKELHMLGTKVTAGMPEETPDPGSRSELLKQGIVEMLERYKFPHDIMLDDPRLSSSACKVVLLASNTTVVNSYQWFRTYPSHHDQIEGSLADALSASMALPTIFAPVPVGPDYAAEEFNGSGLGFNNPIRELLKEAKAAFGDERLVSLILSLGSGRPKELSLEGSDSKKDAVQELIMKLVVSGEKVESEISYQLYDVGAYVRLNVDQGMEEIRFHDWNQLGKIKSHTRKYLQSTSVNKLIDGSIISLEKREGTMSLYQLTRSTRINRQAKSAPAVSVYFVVRNGWEVMETKLTGPRREGLNTFVITGMGGCGKTQMVSYFVQKHHVEFKHVFFIDASSKSSIKSDLQSAIRSIDGHQQDTDIDALSFLANQTSSLLIFDNADDPNVSLVPFFPRAYQGIIIITSRNQDVGELATLHHLQLGPMTHDEAKETLVKASRTTLPIPDRDIPHMNALIEELGALPLALVQAGVYIFKMSGVPEENNRNYSPFEQYLALFKRERAIIMRREGTTSLDEYRRGVYTTLDLSYTLLPSNVRDFLHMCSQFHYTNISLAMLLAAVKSNFKDQLNYVKRPESHQEIVTNLRLLLCPKEERKELYVRELLLCLSSFSLVQIIGAYDTMVLRFHPLVHAWAKESLSVEKASCNYRMATTVVCTCKQSISPAHMQYLPQHIIVLVGKEDDTLLDVEEKLVFGEILAEQGVLGQVAVDLSTQAVAKLEEELGTLHQNTISSYGILSNVYYSLGKRDKSEELNFKIWKMREETLGERDPETLRASADLAATYLLLGKLKEAEDILLKTVELQKEIRGEKHPDTIRASGNLAATYRELGKFKEAEAVQEEVLEKQREVLGERHPDTVAAAANLAVSYSHLGKSEKAEALQAEVLETNKAILGERHPHTLHAAGNLAVTYAELGKIEQAEALQAGVLKLQREILGEQHPYTLLTSANLAETYRQLGKLKEAEDLQVEVLKIRKQVLGERHPDTIQSASHLATTYHSQGRLQEAEALELEVLRLQKEVLGDQHPHTIRAASHLAVTYRHLGKLREAATLEQEIMFIQRESLGEQHPNTINAMGNFAITICYMGHFKRSYDLLKHAAEVAKEALGEQHPACISVTNILNQVRATLEAKGIEV
ncbi:TPR-like protein [Serendipita vermifera]|nr:TPR-like protein [Serendipita vermifera]